MLNTLDVLIGFTVVMLVVSMAVTMLTQFVGSALLDLRGRSLKAGVARLLALMDNGLTLRESKRIADHVLRNPLVGKARMAWNDSYGLASVIHREELVKLLLDFAVPGDATKADQQERTDDGSLRNKLRKSLEGNGIDDPEKVLDSVRRKVTELEKSNPEMSHSARLNQALLHHAASPYLSKLNSWFDQTVDRVSELFTRRIRLVTALVAVALALFLQLDSIGLINRLSVDDQLRSHLVEKAVGEQEALRLRMEASEAALAKLRQSATAGAGDPASNTQAVVEPAAEAKAPDPKPEPLVDVRRTIEEVGVISLPRDFGQWSSAWRESEPRGGGFRWPFLFGILLSAALLSLGAPFWYAALGNLLKMRSLIARKDEAQREERQTTQVAGIVTTVEARTGAP
ncbi:MAG TPA: hypothetical protein VF759_08355 [Allosphingosinicella sp.]|jgi:hypothetical protein